MADTNGEPSFNCSEASASNLDAFNTNSPCGVSDRLINSSVTVLLPRPIKLKLSGGQLIFFHR
jgi:hypothetical protein